MSRDAFNRYTTIAEKLHYLNKKRLETITSEYDISNITQSLNYRESLKIETSSSFNIFTNPSAFIGEQTITAVNDNIITLDDMPSYINVPCTLFYYETKIITVANGLITIPNGKPFYLLGETILSRYNGSHYISYAPIVSGTYELTVPLYAISKSGNDLTISNYFQITPPQEVNIYAPTLID